MAEIWPITLPQKMRTDRFSQTPGDGRIRSAPDRGPARVRRGSSSAPGSLRGALAAMDNAQLAVFRTFVDETLMNGTLAFEFPDQLVTGETLDVRFGESLYAVTALTPTTWDVTLDLEILP